MLSPPVQVFAEIILLKPFLHRRHQLRALLHQLQPQLPRRLQTHRIVAHVLLDHILQFHSQVPVREDFVDSLRSNPVVMLRRHVRRRNHAVIRIHEPQDQEPPVASAGRIFESEGLHAVLEGVGEGEHAACFALHAAEVLHGGLLSHGGAAEDSGHGLVVALLKGGLHVLEGGFHAEVEEGVGDVLDVVVVDCCGDDVCGERGWLVRRGFLCGSICFRVWRMCLRLFIIPGKNVSVDVLDASEWDTTYL